MVSLIFAVTLMGQCANGACSAPSARSAPAIVSYSYSYSGPGVSYSSRVDATGNCTTQRRGFFKRLFRKR